ncbi:MAG: nitronate monooxygenase, partial [Proteobacteria bacterium]|nr:nitronate monooxygenase [Pseudomonadota bacterium]
LATATTLAEARILEDAGVDLIIAQGIEAGGHSGAFHTADAANALPTMELVRTLIQAIDTPIVAAGGLVSGADVRAAIDAGAAGAQLGTVFIPTRQATNDELYRRNLTVGAPTRRTANISGRMARGFISPLMADLDRLLSTPPAYPFTYDATKQLVDAARSAGVADFGVMWAGSGRVRHGLEHCSEVIRLLTQQLKT